MTDEAIDLYINLLQTNQKAKEKKNDLRTKTKTAKRYAQI